MRILYSDADKEDQDRRREEREERANNGSG
jgi:hypothetical protein